MADEAGHRYFFGSLPEMPWKRRKCVVCGAAATTTMKDVVSPVFDTEIDMWVLKSGDLHYCAEHAENVLVLRMD